MSGSQGSQDLGKAVLRIVLGILILMHGIAKLRGGVGFVEQTATQAGLPAWVAYGAYIGEVIAPVLLIIGLWTRAAALLVVVNMLFAVALVHTKQIGMLNETGGWQLELQGMYLAAALTLVLIGGGRLGVGGAGGKWN
ncbi:GntR family transcriptional regulator [Cupriavidus sp. UYMMa02A]|nr:GntR family transcriptional regulator [Cupriavidus sp. UYMMa02A]